MPTNDMSTEELPKEKDAPHCIQRALELMVSVCARTVLCTATLSKRMTPNCMKDELCIQMHPNRGSEAKQLLAHETELFKCAVIHPPQAVLAPLKSSLIPTPFSE